MFVPENTQKAQHYELACACKYYVSEKRTVLNLQIVKYIGSWKHVKFSKGRGWGRSGPAAAHPTAEVSGEEKPVAPDECGWGGLWRPAANEQCC